MVRGIQPSYHVLMIVCQREKPAATFRSLLLIPPTSDTLGQALPSHSAGLVLYSMPPLVDQFIPIRPTFALVDSIIIRIFYIPQSHHHGKVDPFVRMNTLSLNSSSHQDLTSETRSSFTDLLKGAFVYLWSRIHNLLINMKPQVR